MGLMDAENRSSMTGTIAEIEAAAIACAAIARDRRLKNEIWYEKTVAQARGKGGDNREGQESN